MGPFQNGDIALIYKPGIIAWAQGLYATKFKEGILRATHGFFIKSPTLISEANGFSVHESPLSNYLTPDITLWVFRYSPLNTAALMDTYVAAAEAVDGRYSWDGIWDFVKSYITGHRTFQDPRGVFCTDYTGEIIKAGGLPYVTALDPWEIDPTTQLAWFLSDAARAAGWEMVVGVQTVKS